MTSTEKKFSYKNYFIPISIRGNKKFLTILEKAAKKQKNTIYKIMISQLYDPTTKTSHKRKT